MDGIEGVVILVIGVGFIIIGVFIYIQENYDMSIVEGEKVFNKKKNIIKDRVHGYKILICIFSLLLGTFRILSSIIY